MKTLVLLFFVAFACAEVFEFGETKTEVNGVPLSSAEADEKKLLPLSQAFKRTPPAPKYADYSPASALEHMMPNFAHHLQKLNLNTTFSKGPATSMKREYRGKSCNSRNACSPIRGLYSIVATSWYPGVTALGLGAIPLSAFPLELGDQDVEIAMAGLPVGYMFPLGEMFIMRISSDCEICVCSVSAGLCTPAFLVGCSLPHESLFVQPIQITIVDGQDYEDFLEGGGYSHFTFGGFNPSGPSYGLWTLGDLISDTEREQVPRSGRAVATKISDDEAILSESQCCNEAVDMFQNPWLPTPSATFVCTVQQRQLYGDAFCNGLQ